MDTTMPDLQSAFSRGKKIVESWLDERDVDSGLVLSGPVTQVERAGSRPGQTHWRATWHFLPTLEKKALHIIVYHRTSKMMITVDGGQRQSRVFASRRDRSEPLRATDDNAYTVDGVLVEQDDPGSSSAREMRITDLRLP